LQSFFTPVQDDNKTNITTAAIMEGIPLMISNFKEYRKFVSGVSKESEKLPHRGGYESNTFIVFRKVNLFFSDYDCRPGCKTPNLFTFMTLKSIPSTMKYVFLFAALGILIACNNDNKSGEVTATSEDAITPATVDASSAAQATDAMQKKVAELQKLSPYTLDQMKAFLPEELAGAKRSKVSANSAMGAAASEGSYPVNDSTEIQVQLIDCAGEAGAGIYSMQYAGMMTFQSESDEEYTKTIDFNGSKAIEHAKKDNSTAVLSYLAADRLLVTLEGRNTGIDMLKKAAGSLNLK
jgi:hypothetical protein